MPSNSRFAVALHIMVDLSHCTADQVKSSNDMAVRVNTNPVVIRRLYSQLQDAGLINTKPGKFGGACLAKSPKAISLWEIFSAINEASLFSFNPNSAYKKCQISCSMHAALEPVFVSALRAVEVDLRRQKLEQVVMRCRKYVGQKRG